MERDARGFGDTGKPRRSSVALVLDGQDRVAQRFRRDSHRGRLPERFAHIGAVGCAEADPATTAVRRLSQLVRTVDAQPESMAGLSSLNFGRRYGPYPPRAASCVSFMRMSQNTSISCARPNSAMIWMGARSRVMSAGRQLSLKMYSLRVNGMKTSLLCRASPKHKELL